MRCGWISVLLFAGCLISSAASVVPTKVAGLKLELIPDQATYELGTPVTATLRYTYSGEQPVVVQVPLNDIDRMDGLKFTATDPTGKAASDSLPFWMSMSPGQHFSFEPLKPNAPHEEKLVLGQWLLFAHPGRYTITASSDLVGLNEYHLDRGGIGGPVVPLQAEPVVITITPPVEAHHLQILEQARADLANADHHLHWPAMKRLRYLRDPRAIPLLIAGLDDPNDGPINFEAAAGLYVLDDQQQVKSALLKHIDECVQPPPIYAQWIYASLIARADSLAEGKPPGKFGQLPDEQKWDKEIADRLSRKAIQTAANQPAKEESVNSLVVELGGHEFSYTPTLEQKQFILDHAEGIKSAQAYAAGDLIEHVCNAPALIPALKKAATDSKAQLEVRMGAIAALHGLGHDDFCDVIAQDLMSAKPAFSTHLHRLIGDYKSAEIGQALLKLLENPSWEVAESAADRILVFGGGISATDLDQVLQRMAKSHGLHDSQCFRAVDALAQKSPARAVALIQQIADAEGEYNSIHDRVLCRVEEGRPIVLKVLRTGNDYNRAAMLSEMQQVWWDKKAEDLRKADRSQPLKWPLGSDDDSSHALPPNEKLVASYVPEFLRIARTEPDNQTKMIALELLAEICGAPPGYNQGAVIDPEQVSALLPQWQAWSNKHAGDS